MLTLINKQYLTTLVITSGGNADQPRVPDYLNGVRYLISTPNHRAKKQDFQGYLTFLREHGKVAEVEFGMNILHNGDLGFLERQLLNHFRVYCVYVQALQICCIDPSDTHCIEFCRELMASYTKAKKAYNEARQEGNVSRVLVPS